MIEIIIPKFTIYYNIPDKDGIEENDITKRTIKMTKDYSFVILYIYLLILNKNNINISTLDILNELIKIKSLKIKTDGTIQSE